MGLKKELGISRQKASDTFENVWKDHGFSEITQGEVTRTAPIQKRYRTDTEQGRSLIKRHRGMVRRRLGAMAKAATEGRELDDVVDELNKSIEEKMDDPSEKVMSATQVEGPTPLVFDPEILSILKQASPLLELVPEEGQEGYKAVYNRIDQRDDPIGFVSESDSLDVLTQEKDITFTRDEQEMQIYVDVAEISDFTQAAAEHYMNVEETVMAERIAEHAQLKAATMLYGTVSVDSEQGGVYDAEAYDGMATYFEGQSNDVDKSGFSGTVTEDVKAEVADLVQSVNVMKDNLAIYTSYTLKDYMENEITDRARHESSDDAVNFGLETIRITGVPVTAGHQVSSQDLETPVQGDNQGSDEIHVLGDLTSLLSAGDDFDVGGTTFTVGSLNYNSNDNETEITVSGTVSSDLSGDTATFTTLRGDEGDCFIFSTRSFRFRSLVPLSTVPLAKQGLSENMAIYEFGALVSKAEGNFGKWLKAYPQA